MPPCRSISFALPAIACAVACAIGLTGCVFASPLALPEEETGRKNEWFLVYLQGKPAGYFFLREVDLEAGGVETFHRMRLRISRAGEITELDTSITIREKSSGEIVDFISVEKMGGGAQVKRGKVNGRSLELTIGNPGDASPRKLVQPFDPRAVGPHAVDTILRNRLENQGDRVEVIVFAPDALQCAQQVSVAGPLEELILPGGEKRTLRRVDTRLAIPPGISMTTWIDQGGDLIKSAMPIMGLEVVRTTRKAVLAEKFASPPEVFVSSSLRLAQPLPSKREEIVYRLRAKKTAPESLTLNATDAAGHTLQKHAVDGSWRIRVRTVIPTRRITRPVAATARLRPFLTANAYIESDDEKLAHRARLTVGSETDAWTAARKLELWVHDNIRTKNLETAFATAREVFESRAGDCTEHSVLLAAMARAVGIPSRVVAGLTYYRQSFVGHMWTEVWIGEWVALDATVGKGRVEADHIGFTTSALGEASIASVLLGLIPVLSGVEIDVIESR